MDQDSLDAKITGNGSGVLASSSTEAGKVVGGSLKTTTFAECADWPGHCSIGDLYETHGNLFGGESVISMLFLVHDVGELEEIFLDLLEIERTREVVGKDTPKETISVGDC